MNDNPTNAKEQYELGTKYWNGDGGVDRDEEKAIYWYTKAADQGYADALHELGNRYNNGYGVRKDKKRAKGLFTEAFTQYFKGKDSGSADAMMGLAGCYLTGHGTRETPRNWDYWRGEAVKQYTVDAERGDAHAMFCLSFLYETGSGLLVQKDIRKSCNYLLKAAESGSLAAQIRLGECYRGKRDWLPIPVDIKKAIYWYTKAAEQNGYYASDLYRASSEEARGELAWLKREYPNEWAEVQRNE